MDDLTRRQALLIFGGIGAQLTALDLLAGTCGPPPPAKKQRWKGGESFPPLPLPVTPLRRSEKKRPPAPPALIGKLQYGKVVSGVDSSGKRTSYRDWTTDPGDVHNLLNRSNAALGIRYRPLEVSFSHFSFKPQEIPLLYLTGHEGFSYAPKERATLRRYLHDGGMLLGDACCGMEAYRKSFLTEINAIFPQRKIKILPADHPIYTAFYTIDKVGYLDEKEGAFTGPPILEGITVGCREAVLLSQYDLSCGWDGHKHVKGRRVWPADDALRLGVNMVAYSLATYRLGQYLATTAEYVEEKPASGALVVGQIIHGGDWDPNPSAIMTLLKHAGRRSSLSLKFHRKNIALGKDDARQCAILYMTGHDEFVFTPTEAAHLRAYIRAGGILFADACCGRSSFDKAFRREIKKVLPSRPLMPLKPEHQLYRMVVDTAKVSGSAALDAKRQGAGLKPVGRPEFEAISLASGPSVIYSSLGVGCGWEDEACPYCLAYSPASSRDLGLNILAFAMTH